MRKWLQSLVNEYLPAVAELQDTPEDQAQSLQWATWMRQQWAEHGMAELKQQRNLMTDVRGAIKALLGENHLALESMNFTVAEWTMINTPIADQVARRNENVVLLSSQRYISGAKLMYRGHRLMLQIEDVDVEQVTIACKSRFYAQVPHLLNGDDRQEAIATAFKERMGN